MSWPVWLAIISGGASGACFSSFSIATARRICADTTIWQTRSACDRCQIQLRWYQLIPIVSFLVFSGRCSCKSYRLPLFYLVSELTGCATGAILFYYYSPLIAGLYLIAISLLAICAMTDATALILSVPVMLSLAISGLGLQIFLSLQPLAHICILPVAGFGLFWAIEQIYAAIYQRAGMGAGDKWLIGSIGFWVDITGLVIIVNLACLFGLVHAGIYYLRQAGRQDRKLPFGLYLCTASILIVPLQ